MLAWLIEYEWVLFFGLVMAVAAIDLVRTRRSLRSTREQAPDAAGRDGPGPDGQARGD